MLEIGCIFIVAHPKPFFRNFIISNATNLKQYSSILGIRIFNFFLLSHSMLFAFLLIKDLVLILLSIHTLCFDKNMYGEEKQQTSTQVFKK